MSVSPADDPASDGDSDSDAPAYEAHYRPISADAGSDSDDDAGRYTSTVHSNGGDLARHPPPNPSFLHDGSENGVFRLDLNGDGLQVGEEREEEEEAAAAAAAGEEEREREASISRALREDENRRRAPLTRENAARIMEAMRGVSFPGCPPAWVDGVTEDRWVDQLRSLRRGESAPAPQI